MKKTVQLIAGIGLVLLALLVIPSTVLVVFMLPERYQSTARLQISAPPEIKEPLVQRGVPYWVQTEVEVVQSKIVLDQVIERLKLNTVWARKYSETTLPLPQEVSLLILKSMLAVSPVRNTSLIEIRLISENPDEGAQIANEVAKVYLEVAMARAKESARPDVHVAAPARIMDPATPALRPIGSKALRIAVGVLASAVLAVPGGILIFLAIRRPSDTQPKVK